MFSVAFNSLYNYNSECQQNGNILNGSNSISQHSVIANNTQASSVARSTSSNTLDLDVENKKRKDLEYKWVEFSKFNLIRN